MKKLNITFSINGWAEQQIQLHTDEYTPEQVTTMLSNGEVLTSISATGPLILVKDGKLEEIGKVVDSTLEGGDMFDFELNRTWDE